MALAMILMVFPLVGLLLFFVLPWPVALLWYLVGLLVSVGLHWVMMRTMRMPVRTGRRGMIGQQASVVSWRGDRGRVRCHDEIWWAVASGAGELNAGERVRVVDVDGLTLLVEGAQQPETFKSEEEVATVNQLR